MRKKRFTDFKVVEKPQVYDTYDYEDVPMEYGILQVSKKRSTDKNEGLVYSDFNVTNLLQAGATDLLRETPKLKDNAMDVIDNITDNALSDVDGASIVEIAARTKEITKAIEDNQIDTLSEGIKNKLKITE